MSIKEIAKLAGVSPGTVDRVIHKRGNVSQKSREAVESVLNKVGYTPNLHLSSISMKRNYKITIVIPAYKQGDYWSQIVEGFTQAVQSYSNINIECEYIEFDQYDIFSCRKAFSQVIPQRPNAVIIGAIFKDESFLLASQLETKSIPYIYVDSYVFGTNPVAYFTVHHHSCGILIARLLDQITPQGGDIALFQAIRVGDESANNTIMRKVGFLDYLNGEQVERILHNIPFSPTSISYNVERLKETFAKYPNIKGAAVLSSRGGIISRSLKEANINSIKLICLDLTNDNRAALSTGDIDFVLCQRPIEQGSLAIKSLMLYMLFGQVGAVENLMPLDIITRENLKFYRERGDL
ncbi:MAG: substrate-binding domain-containing protein [Rikenellaceae bacterium]